MSAAMMAMRFVAVRAARPCAGMRRYMTTGTHEYSHTLHLPKTAFTMRANATVREPELARRFQGCWRRVTLCRLLPSGDGRWWRFAY